MAICLGIYSIFRQTHIPVVVSFIIPNERNQQGPSHIGLKFLDAFSLQTLETKRFQQQELAGYFLVDSNENCWLQQRKNRMLRPTIEIEINFKNWISARERLDFDQK